MTMYVCSSSCACVSIDSPVVSRLWRVTRACLFTMSHTGTTRSQARDELERHPWWWWWSVRYSWIFPCTIRFATVQHSFNGQGFSKIPFCRWCTRINRRLASEVQSAPACRTSNRHRIAIAWSYKMIRFGKMSFRNGLNKEEFSKDFTWWSTVNQPQQFFQFYQPPTGVGAFLWTIWSFPRIHFIERKWFLCQATGHNSEQRGILERFGSEPQHEIF